MYLFDLSLQTGVFPDSFKIAKVTLFTTCDQKMLATIDQYLFFLVFQKC